MAVISFCLVNNFLPKHTITTYLGTHVLSFNLYDIVNMRAREKDSKFTNYHALMKK